MAAFDQPYVNCPHIDVQHSLQALRPGHGLVPLLWCFVILRLRWVSLSTPGGRHMASVSTVGGEYTMKPCEVYSRFRHQGSQLGNEI